MLTAVVNGSMLINQSQMVSCETSRSLFSNDEFSCGGCVAAELKLVLYGDFEIPKGAEVKLLYDESPQGTFYIYNRSKSEKTGELTLSCYDAMIKANVQYQNEGDTGEWPRKMGVVVQDIATKIGVQVNPETTIADYDVEYPNDYTMREILGYVAAAHAGNWIIDKHGYLTLVGLVLPEETYYLVTNEGDPILFGEVRILVG